MNPWAFVVISLGIILIIVGVKGSQHNIVSAITQKASGTSATDFGASGAGTPPSTNPPVGTQPVP